MMPYSPVDEQRHEAFAAEREKIADRTSREVRQATQKVMSATAELLNACNFEELVRKMRGEGNDRTS